MSENSVNGPKPTLILDEVMSSQKDTSLQEFEPVKLVYDLLEDVDERARDIIIKRFGIDGDRPKTLENLGKSYGITRERVRQIESLTLKELRSGPNADRISKLGSLIHATLSAAGGVMEQESLLTEMLGDERSGDANRAALLFLLNLSDEVEQFTEHANIRTVWASNRAAYDQLTTLLKQMQTIFETENKPLAWEALKGKITQSTNTEAMRDDVLRTTLHTSKLIAENPFGEWGLTPWTEIVPKGVRDKAYLVLRKHAKPLHFLKITERINASRFDARKAFPQTVHNELIKDKRFVLVGRGIYALKEWGYVPGTVADVLTQILEEAGGPVGRAELLNEVLKRRMVKRNTVLIGLQDKSKFKRVDRRTYDLVSRA